MLRLQRGFSFIELMITVVVMGVLAALAIPSMSSYTDNTKIHGTAEVFYASAQSARTEAIRRNVPVQLIFTDQAPTAANADTTGVVAGGPNWIVRALAAKVGDPAVFIDGKLGAEAGGMVVISGPDTLQFNAVGGLASSATAVTVDFTSKRNTCETGGGTARCLRVVVSAGGQARMCDPAATAANDTRKC